MIRSFLSRRDLCCFYWRGAIDGDGHEPTFGDIDSGCPDKQPSLKRMISEYTRKGFPVPHELQKEMDLLQRQEWELFQWNDDPDYFRTQ